MTGICGAFVSATSSSVISACWIVGAARPRPKRVPVATVEKVLALYREKYFDLNVRHFHETLRPRRASSNRII